MIKKVLALAIAASLAVAAIGCAPAAAPAPAAPVATDAPATDAPATASAFPARSADELKFGFIYISNPGDMGFTFAHDNGRLEMEKATGVSSITVENVPENADCEKAIRDLIDNGCNVIVGNSFGYMDFMAEMAQEYKDVIFLHCSGYKSDDNFSNYFGRIYQPRYLSGIAAAKNSVSGKIGYVAAMPIPEVIRGINAFTMGVRAANPNATVEVMWTNSWHDMATEKSAALELINRGCDVLTQHQDSPATQIAAQEKGIKSIGYNADMLSSAPDAFICSPAFNWGVYYTKVAQEIINGTWTNAPIWGSMADGMVKLTDITANAAEGTKEAVETAAAQLMNEDIVFAGPINDNQGNLKVEEGKMMTDAELLSFDWFVEGVIGSIPKN